MKTFYKLTCKACNHIVERSNKEVEHSTIKIDGKVCTNCGSNDLKLWRSRV